MKNTKNERNKTCFLITPIGGETEPIRRHIDGMIDTVIEPLVEEKGYELIVAHRINLTGSINKQVISGIYNADLVIANLTNLNPNVMYELAFSHSIGKPTITIAESGTTKLPFDIATERTIFYKNDFMGSKELKRDLLKIIDSVDKNPNTDNIDNPIYSWLDKSIYESKLVKAIEEKDSGENIGETEVFKYIINKLDLLESKLIDNSKLNVNINNKPSMNINRIGFILNRDLYSTSTIKINDFAEMIEAMLSEQSNIEFLGLDINDGSAVANFEYSGIEKKDAISIITDIIDKAEIEIFKV